MNSNFELVDSGWADRIINALQSKCRSLRIVCPFIKLRAVKHLLGEHEFDSIQVITRFHLGDMCSGVSDLDALQHLLKRGAKIRGVRGLHAKVYLFGNQRVIATSANLTQAGMLHNHEFGFDSSQESVVQGTLAYFDSLWSRAGTDLDEEKLSAWAERIRRVSIAGASPSFSEELPDEGVDIGLAASAGPVIPKASEFFQSFVKFFGTSKERRAIESSILDVVRYNGCHWACTFPSSKRPNSIQDGALMFMGQLVSDPDDIVVFGRAIGLSHQRGRDEATAAEIEKRPFKRDWPVYVRVHSARFVAGTLQNGVRLSELMDELKANCFMSTKLNKEKGEGNTDPRAAYSQQAYVKLSEEGSEWLLSRLESAFSAFGVLSAADMERLDWPAIESENSASVPVAARNMLSALVSRLRTTVRIEDPSTYPTYKGILEDMGVQPSEGRLGPQFDAEGGEALNTWLRESGLPALTGLVVNKDSLLPGGNYYRSNQRDVGDRMWWKEQMVASHEFNWEAYL
jgi:hypothetical protein